MKHFKLTTNTKVNIFGVTLYQVQLTLDCKWGKEGDLGGWVEKEDNIYGNAWISGDAQISGDARIYGDAWISGDARISGNAQISGDAWKKSPLQIQGSKFFINENKKGFLKIGCMSFEFEYWKDNYEEIGKKEGFTDKEIAEYKLYIDLAIALSKL